MRERWAVHASPRVPVEGDSLFPPGPRRANPGEPGWEAFAPFARRWGEDVDWHHDTVLPPTCRLRSGQRLSRLLWFSFLATCVLYDPPADRLLEYGDTGNAMVVRYGDVDPELFDAVTGTMPPPPDEARPMVDPPVVDDPNPVDVQDLERWLLTELIAELGRRHFEPLGIDVYAVVNAILRETGLLEEARRRYDALPLRRLIDVDPETTKEDVLSAFRILKAIQPGRSKGGGPHLDRLTAVQCALLKRQGWTNRQISERFGWELRRDSYDRRRRSNPAISHVKLGEEILEGREYPAG